MGSATERHSLTLQIGWTPLYLARGANRTANIKALEEALARTASKSGVPDAVSPQACAAISQSSLFTYAGAASGSAPFVDLRGSSFGADPRRPTTGQTNAFWTGADGGSAHFVDLRGPSSGAEPQRPTTGQTNLFWTGAAGWPAPPTS